MILTLSTMILYVNTFKCGIDPDIKEPITVDLPNIIVDNMARIVTLKFNICQSVKAPFLDQTFKVVFPQGSVDLQNNDSCSLKIGNTDIPVSRTNLPNSGTSFFCTIRGDRAEQYGKLGETFSLSLSLSKGIRTNYVEQISLSLQTSSEDNSVIIAQTPFFSNLAVYGDYNKSQPSLVASSIIGFQKNPSLECPSPCSNIYPFEDVNIQIKLETTQYIQSNLDALITFEFVNIKAEVKQTLTVTSSKFDINSNLEVEQPLKSANQTLLELAKFRENEYALLNVGENLIKGRKFTINILGYSSTMPVDSLADFLVVRVYWSNTKSIMSYQRIELKARVSPFPMTFTNTFTNFNNWNGIAHPEFLDVYENAAWPIKFTFTIPRIYRTNYVRIEHQSSDNKIIKFIPSTCDFSDDMNKNVYGDNEPGKRPTCNSSRHDLLIGVAGGASNDGNSNYKYNNGIYFPVYPSDKERTITLTVWVSILKCSESDFVNRIFYDIMAPENRSRNEKSLEFHLSMFNKINYGATQIFNEADKVAERRNVLMFGRCFANINNYRDDIGKSARDLYEDKVPDEKISVTKDLLLFLEVSNWSLYNNNGIGEKFLNNMSETDLNESIRFEYRQKDLFHVPLPMYRSETGKDTSTDVYTLNPGYLTLTISQPFVTSTNNNSCELRWFTNNQIDNVPNVDSNNSVNLNSTTNSLSVTRSNLSSIGGYSTTYTNPIILGTQDLSQHNETSVKATFVRDPNTVTHLGFSTNCYKFRKLSDMKVKSLYNYQEFTYKFHRTPNGGNSNNAVVNRVARFIKLFTNTGVFTNEVTSLNSSFSNLHYITTNTSNNEVCIVEVNLSSVNKSHNSVLLTLLNLKLLQIDHSTLSNNYPAYNLNSEKNVFSSNMVYPYIDTAYNMGMLNYSTTDDTYNRTSYISDKLNSEQEIYYQTFFGSTLLLTSKNAEPDFGTNSIYVPVICPKERVNGRQNSHIFEGIVLTSFNLQYELISTKENYNTYLNSPPSTFKIMNNSKDSNNNSVINKLISNYSSYSVKTVSNFNGQFDNYLDVNLANNFYLTSTNPLNCKLTILMTSSSTLTETKISLTNNFGIFEGNTRSSIYAYKDKLYNKFFVFNQAFSITSDNSINYFTGLLRPSLTSYDTNYYDSLKVQCLSSNSFLSILNSGRIKDNANKAETKIDVKITSIGQLLEGDKASSFYFITSIKPFVSKEGFLSIASGSISMNSICAYDHPDSTKIAVNCDVSSGLATCSLSSRENLSLNSSAEVKVCCYNIANPTTNQLFVSGNSRYYDSSKFFIEYSLKEDVSFQIVNSANISTVIPKITNLYYSQVNQHNGLGVVYMKVNLGRNLVPNQRIRITGNFGELYYDRPSCKFTFSNSNDYVDNLRFGELYSEGDYLVDKCLVGLTGFDADNYTIDLYTKKQILRCGMNTANNVIVRISPVRVRNMSKKTYSISSGIDTFDSTNYIAAPPKINEKDLFPPSTLTENMWVLPDQNSSNFSNVKKSIHNNLCNVVSISPLSIGSISNYIFSFNVTNIDLYDNELTLNSTKTTDQERESIIGSRTVNEFTIFLNPSVYDVKDLKCSLSGVEVNCEYSEDGFLNIKANMNLAYNKNTTVYSVGVYGIINNQMIKSTEILQTSNERLLCSVNHYDSVRDRRQNLIVGRGNIEFSTYSPLLKGNLLMLNSELVGGSNRFPREKTNLHLRFKIDSTIDINFSYQEFTAKTNSTPGLIVEFPNEYDFTCFNRTSINRTDISVDLSLIEVNTNALQIGNQRFYLSPTKIELSFFSLQHKVLTLQLKENNLIVNDNVAYFDLNINNLCTPFKQTRTSEFRISLLNDHQNPTKIFKTYSNINNAKYDKVKSSLFEWEKGLTYSFIDTLAYVNIEDIEMKTINDVTIRKGRYNKMKLTYNGPFAISNTTVYLQNYSNLANLVSFESSVPIDSGRNRITYIHLGTNCTSNPGIYFSRLGFTKEEGFSQSPYFRFRILPIHRNIAVMKTSILLDSENSDLFSLAINGLSRIFISTEFIPFEEVRFELSGDERLTVIRQPDRLNGRETFFEYGISGSFNQTELFKVNLTTSNNCFGFYNRENTNNQLKTITFNLLGKITNLDEHKFAESFKYLLSNTTFANDASSLNFEYSGLENTHLFCELACSGHNWSVFPNKSEFLLSSLKNDQTKSLRQLSYNYIRSNSTVRLTFTQLYRGEGYKLRCNLENTSISPLIKSAEFRTMNITQESREKLNITSNNTDYLVPLNLIPKNSVKYFEFLFEKNQTSEFMKAFENGLQRYIRNNAQVYGNLIINNHLNKTVPGFDDVYKLPCDFIRRNDPIPAIIDLSNNTNTTSNTTSNNSSSNNNSQSNSTNNSNNTTPITIESNNTNTTTPTSRDGGRLLQNETVKYSNYYLIYIKQIDTDSLNGNTTRASNDLMKEFSDYKNINRMVIDFTPEKIQGNYTVSLVDPKPFNIIEDFKVEGLAYYRREIVFTMSSKVPIVCNWKIIGIGGTNFQNNTYADIMNCQNTDGYEKCGQIRVDNDKKEYFLNVGLLNPGIYAVDSYCRYNLPETESQYFRIGRADVSIGNIVNENVTNIPCVLGIDLFCSSSYLYSFYLVLLLLGALLI